MPDTLPADSHRAAVAASKPPPAKDMAWIPEGEFLMGSDDFYPEERPAHRVAVDGFWIDEHPVTVAEFRRFVKATGYVTWAERSTCGTSGTGGTGRPARNGAIPRDRTARCTGVSSTR
jgi:formylglycine-generating enzyme required for sulfatase activity